MSSALEQSITLIEKLKNLKIVFHSHKNTILSFQGKGESPHNQTEADDTHRERSVRCVSYGNTYLKGLDGHTEWTQRR